MFFCISSYLAINNTITILFRQVFGGLQLFPPAIFLAHLFRPVLKLPASAQHLPSIFVLQPAAVVVVAVAVADLVVAVAVADLVVAAVDPDFFDPRFYPAAVAVVVVVAVVVAFFGPETNYV